MKKILIFILGLLLSGTFVPNVSAMRDRGRYAHSWGGYCVGCHNYHQNNDTSNIDLPEGNPDINLPDINLPEVNYDDNDLLQLENLAQEQDDAQRPGFFGGSDSDDESSDDEEVVNDTSNIDLPEGNPDINLPDINLPEVDYDDNVLLQLENLAQEQDDAQRPGFLRRLGRFCLSGAKFACKPFTKTANFMWRHKKLSVLVGIMIAAGIIYKIQAQKELHATCPYADINQCCMEHYGFNCPTIN